MSDLEKCASCGEKVSLSEESLVFYAPSIHTILFFCSERCFKDYKNLGGLNVNQRQVGGEHYEKHTPQPWDAISSWGLCFFLGNVVKYVVRHCDKGGVEDLKKARHYLDKKIEILEGTK